MVSSYVIIEYLNYVEIIISLFYGFLNWNKLTNAINTLSCTEIKRFLIFVMWIQAPLVRQLFYVDIIFYLLYSRMLDIC